MKIMKIILPFSLLFAVCITACKGPNNQTKNLIIDSVKIKDGTTERVVPYAEPSPEITVEKAVIRLKDVLVTFKNASNVKYEIEPEQIRPDAEGKKIKIIVKNPPAGYEKFTSKEITVKKGEKELKVNSLTVCGEQADTSSTPFKVRIKNPNIDNPMGFPGSPGEISILFNEDNVAGVQYEGLPFAVPLVPEEPKTFKIKVPAAPGRYKAAEFDVEVTFDTPKLEIKELTLTNQNGDTDIKGLIVKLDNAKTDVQESDITIKFGGKYIDTSVLNAVNPSYEGLPLTGLEINKPKKFKVKVAALEKKYKAFEKEITVIRQNPGLILFSLEVKGKNVDVTNKTLTLDKSDTIIRAKDIKAVFTKGGNNVELPVQLAAGGKAPIYANNEKDNNNISDVVFYLPSTSEYAEYRSVIKVTYTADWKNMIKVPMPDGGITFKSGSGMNSDKVDKTIKTKFELGQFEVTYELWKEVCDWAKSNGYTDFDKMQFIFRGAQGNPGQGKSYPDSEPNQPVTNVPWHCAIVWLNAYSEMKGYAPAYYDKSVASNVEYKKTNSGLTIEQIVTVDSSKTEDEIKNLALRKIDSAAYSKDFTEDKVKELDAKYYQAVVLTAAQAKQTGKENGFRLPHPDEWEYAAKLRLEGGEKTAGTPFTLSGITYYFANKDCAAGSDGLGEENSEIAKVCWFADNSGMKTHRVGSKMSTDLGFYDLSGNVNTWTSTIIPKPQQTVPNRKHEFRIAGGDYGHIAGRLLVSQPMIAINGLWDEIGFRCARTIE